MLEVECRISEKAVHVPVRLRRSTNRHHLLNPRLFFLQHLTLEYRTFISSRFHGSDEYNIRKKKKEKSLSTNRRSVPFFFFFFFFFFLLNYYNRVRAHEAAKRFIS